MKKKLFFLKTFKTKNYSRLIFLFSFQIIFGVLLLLSTQKVQASSILSAGWRYNNLITIDNRANSDFLTDYQIQITLNTVSLISSGKMRSDCGDIRFIDSNGTAELNYWIESGCNTTSTKIWVKIPLIPANSTATIYMYYGNTNATSKSNGTSTFIIFDSIPVGSSASWKIDDGGEVFLPDLQYWCGPNPTSIKSEVASDYDNTIALRQDTTGNTMTCCACTYAYKDYSVVLQDTAKILTFYYSSGRSGDNTWTRPSVGVTLYNGTNEIGSKNLAVEPNRPSNCPGDIQATNNAINTVDLSSISGNFDKLRINLMGYACIGTNYNIIDQIILRKHTLPEPVINITEKSVFREEIKGVLIQMIEILNKLIQVYTQLIQIIQNNELVEGLPNEIRNNKKFTEWLVRFELRAEDFKYETTKDFDYSRGDKLNLSKEKIERITEWPKEGFSFSPFSFSPDGQKFIEITGGIPAVDTDVWLTFLKDGGRRLGIASCGTSCTFDSVFWLNDNEFIITGFEVALDCPVAVMTPECHYFANVFLHNLVTGTVSHYRSSEIGEEKAIKIEKLLLDY